jgi:cytochrome P450
VELRLALLRARGGPRWLQHARQWACATLEAPILWPTHSNRQLGRAIALLDAHVEAMIAQRRQSAQRAPDLLTHLLEAQDEDDGTTMSDKQVRDEILTLFVAGHETTANGLAWALYLLARDPHCYARARAEVDALGGVAQTLADVPRLGLLERVFKEALRLYPPIYLFARMATEAVTIGGHLLPAGTIVLICPWTVQRRPDLWPDPARFDPERFSAQQEAARPRGAGIPFSDGPRICIGAYFALLEAPLVLARLLQRADFELASAAEIVPETTATLRPRGGVPLRVRLRPGRPEPPARPALQLSASPD